MNRHTLMEPLFGRTLAVAGMILAVILGLPEPHFPAAASEVQSQDAKGSYLPLIETHLQQLTTSGHRPRGVRFHGP